MSNLNFISLNYIYHFCCVHFLFLFPANLPCPTHPTLFSSTRLWTYSGVRTGSTTKNLLASLTGTCKCAYITSGWRSCCWVSSMGLPSPICVLRHSSNVTLQPWSRLVVTKETYTGVCVRCSRNAGNWRRLQCQKIQVVRRTGALHQGCCSWTIEECCSWTIEECCRIIDNCGGCGCSVVLLCLLIFYIS